MKQRKHLFILLLLFSFFFSCKDDDDISPSINYPDGVTNLNNNSTNDCDLPKCSLDRKSRLKAENVIGSITDDFNITTEVSFDTHMIFLTCDISDSYKEPGMVVMFSGDAKDACGIWEAVHPIEGAFIIHLTQIDSL